jgi:hypothetical protein
VYRVKSLGGVLTYDGSYLTRLWDWADLLLLLSAVVALCLPYGSHAAQTAKVTTTGVEIHPTMSVCLAYRIWLHYTPILNVNVLNKRWLGLWLPITSVLNKRWLGLWLGR